MFFKKKILKEGEVFNKEKVWWVLPVILFFRLSCWIGFPIVLAIFLGKYLDKKYNIEPWIFLAIIIISFFVSTFFLIFLAFKEFQSIEKDFSEKKIKNSKRRFK